MTPIALLDLLKIFCEEKTKDIILPVRATAKSKGGQRAAEVWKMRLPDAESQTKKAPYILLQLVNGADTQLEGEAQESTCNIRLVFCVYCENDSEGALHVLNLITRIRTALLKERVIGNLFTARLPLEYLVYPDNTAPYFMGEMMTTWELPNVEREVKNYDSKQRKRKGSGISRERP